MRFLFVDRIIRSSRGEWIHGLKHITEDDSYLCVPTGGERAYFAPSLIGETLGQLAAWNVMEALDFKKRPVAGIVGRVAVHRPAYLGETLLLESYIDALDDAAVQYHSVAKVNEEVLFEIEGALGPLLTMDDFIEEEVVRRQYAEINRPGEWPIQTPLSLKNSSSLLHGAVREPFAMFDAVLTSEPGVQLSAMKRITRAASYFADHFPKKPVLPMTVLLECKLSLAREFLMRAQLTDVYQINEMRRIKMNEFVYPGDVVICHLSVKRQEANELLLSFRSEVESKRVCVMELLLTRSA